MSKDLNYQNGELDTVNDALARAVRNAGDSFFLDIDGAKFTFREVDDRSNDFAHGLIALGVAKGDAVVTLLESSVDVFTCWFALSKIGAIWVPINLAYKGEFLRHQISDTDANLVVCDADYVERVMAISSGLPKLRRILHRGEIRTRYDSVVVEPMANHLGNDPTPIAQSAAPQDTALIVYTSGTTGLSKGCMLSQNLLCHLGRQHYRSVARGPDDIEFTCLPLFHMAGLYAPFAALISGGRAAISSRFSVSQFWDDIERSGATCAILIASIFPLLARAPDNEAMKRCRGQLHTVTGIPVPLEIRRIWEERFGVNFMNSFGYGQTEGSKLSMSTPEQPVPPLDSAGPIADEFDVRIFDDDDCEVADGNVGEIVFRPLRPHIMFKGYWKRPEETAKVWRNMWMHTGDLGRIENGYLYFVDRKKDYLRSRGENISSFEVEAAFAKHPLILDVAIHAVQAGTAEDEIKATLVLSPGAAVTCEDICLWSVDNLPYFAVPRFYEIRDELPRNPTGKILKYKLRDEGVTDLTWDREQAGIVVRRR